MFVYADISIEPRTAVLTLIVQAELPLAELSKVTVSPVVGTEALSLVLDAVPQFVFTVASQFAEEPPPTQKRAAIYFAFAIRESRLAAWSSRLCFSATRSALVGSTAGAGFWIAFT